MVVWFSGGKTLNQLLDILCKYYLVIVYAYNKWLEVIQVKATPLTVTKQHLKNFFLHVMDQERWCPTMKLVLQAKSLFNFVVVVVLNVHTLSPFNKRTGWKERTNNRNCLNIVFLHSSNVHQALIILHF